MARDLASALAGVSAGTDPRAARVGTVVSVTGRRAVVRVDAAAAGTGGQIGTDLDVPMLRHVTAAVGDAALLLRYGSALVLVGVFGAAAVTTPPPVQPPPGPPPTTTTLLPWRTGSSRNGGVRGDTDRLVQGDWSNMGRNTGWAHYHRPGAGTCHAARLQLRRTGGGSYAAQAPTLVLLSNAQPAGTPTIIATHAGPALTIGQAATVDLPASWGQSLLNGTAGGVGCYVGASAPYVCLDGLAGWPGAAMALTLTYVPGG